MHVCLEAFLAVSLSRSPTRSSLHTLTFDDLSRSIRPGPALNPARLPASLWLKHMSGPAYNARSIASSRYRGAELGYAAAKRCKKADPLSAPLRSTRRLRRPCMGQRKWSSAPSKHSKHCPVPNTAKSFSGVGIDIKSPAWISRGALGSVEAPPPPLEPSSCSVPKEVRF